MDDKTGFDFINAIMNADAPEQQQQSAEQVAAMQLQQMETAHTVRRALVDNPDGAILLDMLVQATLMTPLMRVSQSLPVGNEMSLAPADWSFLREGQNSLVHWLREQVQLSLNPPQPQQQDNDNG